MEGGAAHQMSKGGAKLAHTLENRGNSLRDLVLDRALIGSKF